MALAQPSETDPLIQTPVGNSNNEATIDPTKTTALESPPDLTLDDDKEGIELSLEESIKEGLRTATNVLKSQNQVRFSGAQLLQAYGQFLPNLQATANYGFARGTNYSATAQPVVINGSNANAGYTLFADLNIFNGISDLANLRSSTLKKDVADLSLVRAKQQIALDITQTFLQVVLDDSLVLIARKNLQASQERERLLQAQTTIGARNLSDLFRQQAQTSADEAFLLNSENRKRTDQITFLIKLRLDVAKSYHFISPNLSQDKGSHLQQEDVLLREGLTRRVDLKAADKYANATHWDIKTAASTYWPKLDLLAGLTGVGHTLYSQTVSGIGNVVPSSQADIGSQLRHQIDYSIGLNLTWTLFDRFLTNENISRARTIAENSDIDAEDKKNQVKGDVRESYGDYLNAAQQLRSSKKGYDAAHKAYEVMEGRYSVGSASFLDLITSQATLVQAESTRAQALINFALQEKSLEFATGALAAE
jgi:outer membrane protein